MECIECGKGKMKKQVVEYMQFGESFGSYPALVCTKCNETLFEGSVSLEIEAKAKELGVFGLSRRSKIGTSGTALDVKIPKRITEFLQLKKGQDIIIEPRARNKIEITII